MANRINNKYEYRSGLLDSLKVQHTASDVRNEDEYRKKVLNGLGVEYTEDDINQKNLYRAKVVEGLASSGGGGSSDFSTAEVTVVNNYENAFIIRASTAMDNDEVPASMADIDSSSIGNRTTLQVILYKGNAVMRIGGFPLDAEPTITTSGNIQYIEIANIYTITGDCTITIS